MTRWMLTINYGGRIVVHRDLSRRQADRLADREMATAVSAHAAPMPRRTRGEGTYR